MKLVNNIALSGCLIVLLGLSVGCGNSTTTSTGSSGGAAQTSTDATANLALITNFTDTSSVTGTWTNNFFGSSGDINITYSFNATTNMLTITVDIGGGVFGGSDPDGETFDIDLTDFIANGTDTINISSATYGDITGTITFLDDGTGTFTGSAANIASGATNATISGTFSISGTTVSFSQDSLSFDFGGDSITVTSTF